MSSALFFVCSMANNKNVKKDREKIEGNSVACAVEDKGNIGEEKRTVLEQPIVNSREKGDKR